jgi:ankyrin repeat protein
MDIKISVIRPHLEVMYSPQYNMYKNSINACLYDKLEVAKFLVSSGAEISAANKNGETPLHNACIYDNLEEVVKFLDDIGADKSSMNKRGSTPLHNACSNSDMGGTQVPD